MGVSGQCYALATLPPGKTRYPFYRGLGGPQGWSGLVWKNLLPPGFDPWAIQPVSSRYTDRALPSPIIIVIIIILTYLLTYLLTHSMEQSPS